MIFVTVFVIVNDALSFSLVGIFVTVIVNDNNTSLHKSVFQVRRHATVIHGNRFNNIVCVYSTRV